MQIFFTRLILGFLEYVYAIVSPTPGIKLRGRGPRAEADAARRLRAGACPVTRNQYCGRRAARQPCELTSRLGRRDEAGPRQLLCRVGLRRSHFVPQTVNRAPPLLRGRPLALWNFHLLCRKPCGGIPIRTCRSAA
jgi:hypothetical protein